MGWKLITPKSTTPESRKGLCVSMSWVPFENVGLPRAGVRLSKGLVSHMRWRAVRNCLVHLGEDENLGEIMIEPSNTPDRSALMCHANHGSLGLYVPLPGVVSHSRPPQRVDFRIFGECIIVTCPDWAAPERLRANTDKALAEVEKAMAKEAVKVETPPPPKVRTPYVSLMTRVPDPAAALRSIG